MITLYEVLGVAENATKDEIDLAYSKMVNQYKIDPSLSDEVNNDNRVVLEKLKSAYDVLADDEKRQKYNGIIAKKRAEELLKGVKTAPKKEKTIEDEKEEYEQELRRKMKEEQLKKKEEAKNSVKESSTSTVTNPQVATNYSAQPQTEQTTYVEQEIPQNGNLTEEQKARLREAAQAKFNANLQMAQQRQQAQDEYQKAYQDAYNQYVNAQKKEEFNTKFKKILRIVLVVIILIVIFALMMIIPPTRAMLNDLYESNIIIKYLVDIVVSIFKAIFGIK